MAEGESTDRKRLADGLVDRSAPRLDRSMPDEPCTVTALGLGSWPPREKITASSWAAIAEDSVKVRCWASRTWAASHSENWDCRDAQ